MNPMMDDPGAMNVPGDDESTEQHDQMGSPPNYRVMTDPTQNCKNCVHYDPDAKECEKYETEVKPYMVCDSFSNDPADAQPEQTEEAGETSAQ